MEPIVAVKQRQYIRHKGTLNKKKSMTSQHHKDECDVNQIMKGMQPGNLSQFVDQWENTYVDFLGLDFQESMNMIDEAQYMFDQLPSNIRTRFDNDPGAFLEFVNNPVTRQEAYEAGLIKTKPAEAVVEPEVIPPPA